jgi:DNA-3-methyladenine glycosylase II
VASAKSRRIVGHLTASDPRLARLIRGAGWQEPPRHPAGFPALVRSIIFQQISGSAGAAILRRVIAVSGGKEVPSPRWFQDAPESSLRSAGLSPQKISYLRDLSSRVLDGRLPLEQLLDLPDEEVVQRLTEVRGIGEWTAQMYLMFHLGRPDVLPTGDLGLRKAVGRLHRMKSLPAPSTVARLGRAWAPYRSHATFYLWRSLEDREPVAAKVPKNATGVSRRSATRRGRPRRSR